MRRGIRFLAVAVLAATMFLKPRAAVAQEQLTCEQVCLVTFIGCGIVTEGNPYCGAAYQGCLYGCNFPH